MTGSPHPMSGFDEPVRRWQDIPGWFQWRSAQTEAVAHFGDGSRFVEVGCYLGEASVRWPRRCGRQGAPSRSLG